jgi:DNA-binding XRE family transcriptional regulator
VSGERSGDAVYNRIALLRAEQGVTRRQLADTLGVHYQTVGYLERGEYNPSLHLALRIAEFFGLPVETIFSTEPFPRISDLPRAADAGDETQRPGRTA